MVTLELESRSELRRRPQQALGEFAKNLWSVINPYPRPTSTPLAHRFVASYVENWMAPESSARTAFGSMPA